MQTPRQGRKSSLIVERFGPFAVALALVAGADCLYLVPRRWSCLGLPLPKFLLPAGTTFESERDWEFDFDVEIRAPLVGLIVSYKGALRPE